MDRAYCLDYRTRARGTHARHMPIWPYWPRSQQPTPRMQYSRSRWHRTDAPERIVCRRMRQMATWTSTCCRTSSTTVLWMFASIWFHSSSSLADNQCRHRCSHCRWHSIGLCVWPVQPTMLSDHWPVSALCPLCRIHRLTCWQCTIPLSLVRMARTNEASRIKMKIVCFFGLSFYKYLHWCLHLWCKTRTRKKNNINMNGWMLITWWLFQLFNDIFVFFEQVEHFIAVR